MSYTEIFYLISALLVIAYEAYLMFVKKVKPINCTFFIVFWYGILLTISRILKENDIISPASLESIAKVLRISLMIYLVFLLVRWLKLPEKVKNMFDSIKRGNGK